MAENYGDRKDIISGGKNKLVAKVLGDDINSL